MLWSLDDYYYYAFCIALISVASITTTLIETQKVGHCVLSQYDSNFSLSQILDNKKNEGNVTSVVHNGRQ